MFILNLNNNQQLQHLLTLTNYSDKIKAAGTKLPKLILNTILPAKRTYVQL